MSSLRKRFGQAVRRLRKVRGYNSGVRFAAVIGMDRAHLTDIEHGRVNVGLDLIERIAKALKLAPSELFAAAEEER